VSGDAARLIREWGDLWGAATLPSQVTVEFSPRMRRAAGRALVDQGLVRLASWLRDAPRAIHDEILCHEVAHVAARLIHGRKIRPHGPEWKGLMRQAGYAPRVRLDPRHYPGVEIPRLPARRSRPAKARYLHRCPICQAARVARRPVRGWRCAVCVRAGRNGTLDIYRLERSTPRTSA